MKPEITLELLAKYFSGGKRMDGYDEACSLYRSLRVHSDGEYPIKLIDERRPHESDMVKMYRRKIYEPITEDVMGRVMESLTKIRRSADWSVTHPVENYPSSVVEKERLGQYADTRMPVFGNAENWLFTVALKNYCIDANAILLVSAINEVKDASDYVQPVPLIYNSPEVLEYIPDHLLIVDLSHVEVVASRDVNEFDAQPKLKMGGDKEFLVVTSTHIEKWKPSGDTYAKTYSRPHRLSDFPAIRLGGKYYKRVGKSLLMKSRLSAMLPRLNEGVREYSDLQAEVVQHVHSEKWVMAIEKCPKCRDSQGIPTGFVNGAQGKKMTCPTCQGNLLVPNSPYQNIVVRAPKKNMGEEMPPTPPAGYITKDTAIVKIQDERIDKHLYRALCAINMQFLDKVPVTESGIAKEVDRDDLNNFVYGVAEDLVRLLQFYYDTCIEYRYALVVPEPEKRKLMRPRIPVPEKFDLLSSNYLAEEIKAARDAGVSPVITARLETEYAGKKFYNDPSVRDMVQLVLELDPLSGVAEESKLMRVTAGGISRLDYVLSSNINAIVAEAMATVKGFGTAKREAQLEAVRGIAAKMMSGIDSLRVPLTKPE